MPGRYIGGGKFWVRCHRCDDEAGDFDDDVDDDDDDHRNEDDYDDKEKEGDGNEKFVQEGGGRKVRVNSWL